MIQDIHIYNPLEQYRTVFKGRFKEIADSTFKELKAAANIDATANKRLCTKIYAAEGHLSKIQSRLGKWIFWCVMLWLASVACLVCAIVWRDQGYLPLYLGLAMVVMLIFLFAKVHPTIKRLKKEKLTIVAYIHEKKEEAWAQMEPLNRLYDWDILMRMMSATVPRLEFDPFFTTQRLEDLRNTYNWDETFNSERSVIFSHSGVINGNPFVICRTRKMEMGTKVYTGSKVIHWTTTERGSDGKMQIRHHTQTLTASVRAPYPEYPEKTRLFYGNTAAPGLIFNRRKNGLAGEEDSFRYRRKHRKLRRKARDLETHNYAMMSNDTFEVLFDTSDRNDNQEFALLFTPLAQENMIALLRDEVEGYGDDFDFSKLHMINIITANHMQSMSLEMNPASYKNFDLEKAEKNFYGINAEYFRAIYFALAPLLCIPMYQQIRSHEDIYGYKMKRRSAYWEHEALANYWGNDPFKHPDCVTPCILKTQEERTDSDCTINVTAYGYRAVPRITEVTVLGGDGRYHEVPVEWKEYFPVEGQGSYRLKEDETEDEKPLTPLERLMHNNEKIRELGEKGIYRRHIASNV